MSEKSHKRHALHSSSSRCLSVRAFLESTRIALSGTYRKLLFAHILSLVFSVTYALQSLFSSLYACLSERVAWLVIALQKIIHLGKSFKLESNLKIESFLKQVKTKKEGGGIFQWGQKISHVSIQINLFSVQCSHPIGMGKSFFLTKYKEEKIPLLPWRFFAEYDP